MCTRSNGNAIDLCMKLPIELIISFKMYKCVHTLTAYNGRWHSILLQWNHVCVCMLMDSTHSARNISCNFVWKCCFLFSLWTSEQLLRTKVNCLLFIPFFPFFFQSYHDHHDAGTCIKRNICIFKSFQWWYYYIVLTFHLIRRLISDNILIRIEFYVVRWSFQYRKKRMSMLRNVILIL